MKRVTFKCEFCPFKAASKGQYGAHVNTHSVGVNAFTCSQDGCHYRTMQRHKLKEHLERHDPNRKKEIPCPLCPKLFYTDHLMRSHLRAHTNERELQCEVCEYRAQTRTYLNIHRQKQHSLQPLEIQVKGAKVDECEICGYKTWSFGRLYRHVMSHSDEKPFKCTFLACNFSTKRQDCLQTHERGHDPEKAFHCEFPGCTYRTGHKGNLRDHVETHNKKKLHSCSFPGCQFRSKVRHDVKCHERTVHNPERKREFQCTLCDKSFLRLRDLQAHTRSHTKEKHFTCHLCPYSSAVKRQLYLHLVRTHEKVLAEDPEILQRHDIKTEAKKLICEFGNCDHRCWFRKGMERHVETVHLGLRPFACSFNDCGMAFKTKGDLRGHKKTHDPRRDRVHKCPICTNRSFYRPKDVKRHILSDHKDDNPYKCRYCRYVSLNIKDVLSHMGSDHLSELRAQMKTATVAIQRTELEYL